MWKEFTFPNRLVAQRASFTDRGLPPHIAIDAINNCQFLLDTVNLTGVAQAKEVIGLLKNLKKEIEHLMEK